MKKIIYFMVLSLCAFCFFGCIELQQIQKAASSVSSIHSSIQNETEKDEIPEPDTETYKVLEVFNERPDNYWIPKTESSENPPRMSFLIGTKDLNILIEDLSNNNFEKIFKNTDLDPSRKTMMDGQMMQVFGMYYLLFNDGRGSPINFCAYDIKYSAENATHNGWETSALIFHATQKENIYGQYELDEFEYYMYKLK